MKYSSKIYTSIKIHQILPFDNLHIQITNNIQMANPKIYILA